MYDFTLFLCCWIGCRREDANQDDQRQDAQYLQVKYAK